MALTPQDVRDKKFTTTRFKPGYDEDEVDAFLDEVEAELAQLLTENTVLRDRVTVLESAPPPPTAVEPAVAEPAAPAAAGPAGDDELPAAALSGPSAEMEEMLRRTLLLAQRTADQAVAEAQEEAARLKAEAQAHADRLVGEAKTEAERHEREATARREAAVAAIEADRRAIEAQVEALRGFEREYRTRLKAYLELQLRELDNVGRATAPTATGPVPTPAATPPAQS
ncbi:MAG TPA: DivIVA domain-containing protein [Mycobacteriales bacterium]|nr:DivIVA domain-containing protein [Mycobacteriales bacterium]